MKKQKLLAKVLSGSKNISFGEMQTLVTAFGFSLSRINGSHHIYSHPDVDKVINLQSVKGQAKPYQIKQFLCLVETHNLSLEDDEET